MSDTSWHEELGRRAVTAQIIVGALFAGSFGFLVVAAVLVQGGMVEPNEEMAWAMNLVLIAFLVAEMLALAIVPRLIVAQGRRKIAAGQWPVPQGPGQEQFTEFVERCGDAGRLLAVYQTKKIIACALLEGVAFFAIIVYLITRSPVGLAVAIVMIVGLAFHFPTRSGVVHWIEDQLGLIERERRSQSI